MKNNTWWKDQKVFFHRDQLVPVCWQLSSQLIPAVPPVMPNKSRMMGRMRREAARLFSPFISQDYCVSITHTHTKSNTSYVKLTRFLSQCNNYHMPPNWHIQSVKASVNSRKVNTLSHTTARKDTHSVADLFVTSPTSSYLFCSVLSLTHVFIYLQAKVSALNFCWTTDKQSKLCSTEVLRISLISQSHYNW